MRKHRCTAIGCKGTQGKDEVFCKKHWFELPKLFRDEIWAAHRASNRIGSLTAISNAVKWLEENE